MKYIYDDNKVRVCASNIANMNVLEYVYYSIFHWGYFQRSMNKVSKHSLELIENVLVLGVEIFKLITFPVFIITYAILHIRANKKWIEKIK